MQCNDKKRQPGGAQHLRFLGGLGELLSIDQQHPIPSLPLEDPVGHQPLDELVLI